MSSDEANIHNRFLGFLLWQFFQSTLIYTTFKTIFFLAQFNNTSIISYIFSLSTILSLLVFTLSHLLFSAAISAVSSPQPDRAASPFELALRLVKLLVVSGDYTPDFIGRARVSVKFVIFVAVCSVSGFLSAASLCWVDFYQGFGVFGIRGFAVGLIYGLHFVLRKRWILVFPIIQRPLFFRYKMGISLAVKRALKLSSMAYLFSGLLLLLVFLPQNKVKYTNKFISEQTRFYIGSFGVFICWELSHHLHQVLLTKRLIIAPHKGSAAAETNPSERLLLALEESTPRSLLQYLAYLDLKMVCESNVDIWRRAAFFEETGETYKRVVALCLRPLERLVSDLGVGLAIHSAEITNDLSHQLQSPTKLHSNSKFYELSDNFQICAWCAQIVSSLTVSSRTDDRFGVAQLSGSNALAISTLFTSLLAIETLMGKKTNIQNPNQLTGPANIKWNTRSTGKREVTAEIANIKRGVPMYSKAYAMADILRTSIYQITTAFHDEMLTGAKSGLLEKDWIVNSKPLYGTRELLLQKLRMFLDFRAN